MSLWPSARATDTRWWPSFTKCSSPIRYTSIGGMAVPRRWAAAIRSQRVRTLPGGRAEAAVELAAAVHGSHDRVERDHLLPEPALAAAAERGHHLLEREDHVHVARLAAKAVPQARERTGAARAGEVELRVGVGKSGVLGHLPSDTRRVCHSPRA